LPRRVGAETAQRLIDDKLPVSAEQAAGLGLVDEVGPRHPEAYAEWLTALARRLADAREARRRQSAKSRKLAAERVPLDVYESRELAEMSSDMFSDRSGFAAARLAFVSKAAPAGTPDRLLLAPPAEPPAARKRQLNRPRAVADSAADAQVRVRSAVPLSA
jgi:putative two-component system hydrogenase maturation factor HypX/HoxX